LPSEILLASSLDGKYCYETIWDRKEPCRNCLCFQVLHTNTPREGEWFWAKGKRIYQTYNHPFTDIPLADNSEKPQVSN